MFSLWMGFFFMETKIENRHKFVYPHWPLIAACCCWCFNASLIHAQYWFSSNSTGKPFETSFIKRITSAYSNIFSFKNSPFVCRPSKTNPTQIKLNNKKKKSTQICWVSYIKEPIACPVYVRCAFFFCLSLLAEAPLSSKLWKFHLQWWLVWLAVTALPIAYAEIYVNVLYYWPENAYHVANANVFALCSSCATPHHIKLNGYDDI